MILTGVKRLFDEVSSIALPESDQSGKTEQAPPESLNTMKPGSKNSVPLGDARHVRTGGNASSKCEVSSSSSSNDDEIDRIARQTVDEAFSRPFSPLPHFPKVRKIAPGQRQASIPCGITDEFENFSLSERVNKETESSEPSNAKSSRVLIRVRVPRRLKKKVRDGETNKAQNGGRKIKVTSIGSPRPAPNVQHKASRTRMRDVSERLFEYINAYRDYSGARILDWNEMLYEICVVGTTVMVPSRRMKEYYPNIGVDYVWLGLKMDLTNSGQKEDEKITLCGKVGAAIMNEILSKKVYKDKILEKSASYMAVDVFGNNESIFCNVIMTGMPPFTNKPKRHDEIAREATDGLKMRA